MSWRDAVVVGIAGATPIFLVAGTTWRLSMLKLLWACVLLVAVAAVAVRHPAVRRPLLAAGSLVLMLALAETGGQLWKEYGLGATVQRDGRANRNLISKELGYRPRASMQQRARKWLRDGTPVYDVSYTIDEHHWRETPRRSSKTPKQTVFFFGCSVTFGVGVEDDETFAHRFAAATGYEFHVVNFGISGWGPHQMLRLLELGLPDEVVVGEVRKAFYIMPTYHLNRVAGEVVWDLEGPRYEVVELESGGKRAVHRGSFGQRSDRWRPILRRSWIWKTAKPLWSRSDEEKRALAVETVAEAQRLLRNRYDTELFVIVMGSPEKAGPLAAALAARGIPNAEAEEWVPTFDNRDAFVIEGDGHPNVLWHHRMGRAIADRLDDTAPDANVPAGGAR